MLKIAGIGIVGVILALQFKSGKQEYGIYITIGISLLMFTVIFFQFKVAIEELKDMVQMLPIKESYVEIFLRMIGIAFVSEFASAICQDAGYQSIASQIQLFAKVSILIFSIPVAHELMQTISGIFL